MALQIPAKDLDKIIMVGDRVLLQPSSPQEKTKSGLFLPPGISEKEKVYTGYVVKIGPGYPIPAIADYDEPWKDKQDQVKYVPLQPKVGDLAVYLQSPAHEVHIAERRYAIVPHSAILLLFRDEGLFK